MATQSNTRVDMTRLLFISLCIVSVSFIAAQLTCPEGETVNNCPTSCRTTCPKSEKEAKESCPTPNPCPEPACQCSIFDRRADNGTCINTRECPPFDCSARPNERFDPCPALCPSEDCSQAYLKGRCRFHIGTLLICNPECRCIKDHYRKDGICVPEAECGIGSTTSVKPKEESKTPSADDTRKVETQTLEISPSGEISEAKASATSDPTDEESSQTLKPKDNLISTQTADSDAVNNELKDDKNFTKPQAYSEANATSGMSTNEAKSSSGQKAELTCPESETVNNCPTSCRTTCPKSEKEAKESCPTPNPCPEPACQCSLFDRRADNGTCINTRECPPFDCSARPNERYDPCPALCPTEDCSEASLKGKCSTLFGNIGIVLICNPACRCIKDHYRKDGICVPEAECGNGSTTAVKPNEETKTPSADDTRNVETQTLDISPSGEISEANASASSDPTDEDSNQTIKPKDNPMSTQMADSASESDNKLNNDDNYIRPQAYSEAKATSGMSTSYAKSSSGQKARTCGPNEEFSCRKSCPPDTCASNTIRCGDVANELCKRGCYCKEGFLRANGTAPCMPQCNCENIANTDLCKQV